MSDTMTFEFVTLEEQRTGLTTRARETEQRLYDAHLNVLATQAVVDVLAPNDPNLGTMQQQLAQNQANVLMETARLKVYRAELQKLPAPTPAPAAPANPAKVTGKP